MAKGRKTGGRQKGTPDKGPRKPRKRAPTARKLAKDLADTYTRSSDSGEARASPTQPASKPSAQSPVGGSSSGSPPPLIAAPLPPAPADLDPLDVLLQLTSWSLSEFDRLRAAEGQREELRDSQGRLIRTRTAEDMARMARQFAIEALPYMRPRMATAEKDPRKVSGGVVVKIVRQGSGEEITVATAVAA